MYQLTISNSAKTDLNIIFNYCTKHYGLSYALKVRNKIKVEISQLKIFPESNPIYAIINNIIFRKQIINNRYIIVFQIIFNQIYVLYIYDARRNITPQNLFNNLN